MNLVLFGPPGSGKGTQARLLSQFYGMRVLSTGEILRSFVESEAHGLHFVKNILDSGQLVDDNVVCDIVLDSITRVDCGFLLDGFPRNVVQAKFLASALDGLSKKISSVIELIVPDDLIEQRIQGRIVCCVCKRVYSASQFVGVDAVCECCGSREFSQRRDDSDLLVIRKRVAAYKAERDSLCAYYSDCLISIDGGRSAETVFCELKKRLEIFT